MKKISVRKCCHICDNLYNNEKCPLYSVYNSAAYYGDSTFDDSAKYRVVCDEFELSKKVKMEEITVNGFELMALNREFAELLKAHKDDTEVHGESRKDFKHLMNCVNNDEGLVSYHASICNAWDELCDRHDGLRGSGLSWFAGAEWTDYPNNDWDVYVGTGDELD